MTLDEEIQKAKLVASLEMKKMLVDKLLFGAILAMFGLGAAIYLETLKSSLTQDRFLLENRLAGLKEIREAYNPLSESMTILVRNGNHKDKALKISYQEDINKFMAAVNEHSFLFPSRFEKTLQRHIWIHMAFAHKEPVINDDHRSFGSSIFQAFDRACREVLATDALGEKYTRKSGVFQIVAWDRATATKKGVTQYMQENYEAWKTWGAKTANGSNQAPQSSPSE